MDTPKLLMFDRICTGLHDVCKTSLGDPLLPFDESCIIRFLKFALGRNYNKVMGGTD
jgi:hypothetical protein